jgi:ABC-2 type transport system ATP-binding protein
MPVVIEKISKNYGKTLALKDVSFTIKDKARFGILGPNGAGKSTLLLLMCTLLKQNEGIITFDGLDVADEGLSIMERLVNKFI